MDTSDVWKTITFAQDILKKGPEFNKEFHVMVVSYNSPAKIKIKFENFTQYSK